MGLSRIPAMLFVGSWLIYSGFMGDRPKLTEREFYEYLCLSLVKPYRNIDRNSAVYNIPDSVVPRSATCFHVRLTSQKRPNSAFNVPTRELITGFPENLLSLLSLPSQ